MRWGYASHPDPDLSSKHPIANAKLSPQLVATQLAKATIRVWLRDVARQTRLGNRAPSLLRTWKSYTCYPAQSPEDR